MTKTLPIGPASPKQELFVKRFQEGVKVILLGGAMGCVPSSTEFLSDEGWKKISEYHPRMKVAEYIPETDSIEFREPNEYIKLPCNSFKSLQSSRMSMTLSGEHVVLYKPDLDYGFKTLSFDEVVQRHQNSKTKGWTGKLRTAFTGVVGQEGLDITEGELRLQVAVMADGRVVKNGANNYTQMRFAKKRKYERLLELCNTFGLSYIDNGCKSTEKYTTGTEYEVVVFPKWKDKKYSHKYYKCSKKQLDIIADEVCHWDGTLQKLKNSISWRYYSKNKSDADFIQYVFASTGKNTKISYHEKDEKRCYTVFSQESGRGFRSFANKDGKCPIVEVPSKDGYKYCFNTNSGYFVIRENDNIFMTGNSGKSYLLQMITALRVSDPRTRIGMTRRTLSELEGSGGLLDTCYRIYSENLSDYFSFKKGRKNNYPCIKFFNGKNGAEGSNITFMPMCHEGDVEKWRGLQLTTVGIDEAHLYSENQINMIISRLRSEADFPSQLIMTCNPDPDWYWCDQIKDYYLDEEGMPIQERAGDVRYYFRLNGDYVWANSAQELIEDNNLIEVLENQGVQDAQGQVHNMIMSFTFIPMNVYDNPPVLKNDPDYVASLLQQSEVEKKRNLWGCWFARPEGSGLFKREWIRGENGNRVKRLRDIPENCIAMRAVDKAYQIPNDNNPSPDFNALSPLFLKDPINGMIYMVGNYHEATRDEKTATKSEKLCYGRFRRLPGERDRILIKQMVLDESNAETLRYQKPKLVVSKDNAGGGSDYFSTITLMAEYGIDVIKDTTISNQENKKMVDFVPFTKAASDGVIFVVEESFDKETLETYWAELEQFDGQKNSNRTRKDDWVDSTSACFNAIVKAKRPYRTPLVGSPNSRTISSDYLNKMRK